MYKPIRKQVTAKTAQKSAQAGKTFRHPGAKEIRRAAGQAVAAAASRTDRDVMRAIAKDADTFEADPARLVTIRPNDVDVARIRSGLGLTQAGFAAATGIPHRLISDWEQGRKKPSAAARAFLLLVDEFGEKALRRLARRAAA
ncbi:MAG: helix-turn-helix domain-containing protein [Alphaproteobacteria bacterium]